MGTPARPTPIDPDRALEIRGARLLYLHTGAYELIAAVTLVTGALSGPQMHAMIEEPMRLMFVPSRGGGQQPDLALVPMLVSPCTVNIAHAVLWRFFESDDTSPLPTAYRAARAGLVGVQLAPR